MVAKFRDSTLVPGVGAKIIFETQKFVQRPLMITLKNEFDTNNTTNLVPNVKNLDTKIV